VDDTNEELEVLAMLDKEELVLMLVLGELERLTINVDIAEVLELLLMLGP
jgi:hypothetical protein